MNMKDTHMTKKELEETAEKYLNETFKRFDFIAEKGEGMYVIDEEGTKYLDFMGGIAVNATGNCNERVVQAIKDQAEMMIHSSNYCYTIPQIMLAKLICENIGMDKIFFQNSGAEANEAMIKLARKYGTDNFGPDRYKIVTALNSFHGRTYATLTATGQPDSACQKGYAPLLPGFSYAEYNNLESFKNACDENTIAIMIEPVQGEGGVYPATEEFIKGLREFCDEKNMLLLFDEVQTGWGRTGDLMGYITYGIKPDAVSMAKAMGGGMPIGAMCTTKELAKTFGPGAHGTTFGGNPVCCAAAYAQITEMIEKNLPEKAREMGLYLMKKLENLPGVREIRGKGLLVGVEFNEDIAFKLKYLSAEKHLLITAVRDNIIRLAPPLLVSREECDKAVEILKNAAEELL